jgi:hypothetical protein
MRRILSWCLVCVLAAVVPAFAGQTGAAKTAQAPAAPVNLNTASQADLEALPGVGPATAKKIIAGRPYASIADLAKAGVPKSTIAKITPLVTVGAAPGPAANVPEPKPAPVPTTGARTATAPATAQQPPAKGMVWVNLDTKVFHREGDRYYGNTKHGKFMTEAEAVSAGYREAKTGGKKPKP